ncbi:MAG TPA: hypothetical protein VFJ85_04815 [Acidimicrobiales bacterium]|nr:hypothetical protein [Acidimicrobiales bacterium]
MARRRPPQTAGDPSARLAAGARDLPVGDRPERSLLLLAGALVPLGFLCIVIAWLGAARTANVYEQVPYLISGGLVGLGLVFLGSLLYFAHWLTRLVHEQRAQTAAVVAAVDRLAGALEHRAPPPAPVLVATGSGSLAHRPDCRIVAGKADLRAVSAGDGLAPCRLCQPW